MDTLTTFQRTELTGHSRLSATMRRAGALMTWAGWLHAEAEYLRLESNRIRTQMGHTRGPWFKDTETFSARRIAAERAMLVIHDIISRPMSDQEIWVVAAALQGIVEAGRGEVG